MAEITMCMNPYHCPKRKTCYRWLAIPDPKYQSMSSFENCNKESGYESYIKVENTKH